ncbi:flavin reductase family protein [Robertkochia solimangrovi]|uniref:flavin reductase family protein n=1 Tax=Robertkochia solimangrovi TaxID=2213046 RepID=UPI00117F0B0E|nr:flavin reductase family protein [Robertkochia solimangrovi]TRZ44484.1 flavin reductase family protein [Robertkochia solimangrovi]
MLTISPGEVTTAKLHGYLLGAVGPRPIAFASTIDKDGRVNLSPFSFFNVFSANPPILIFSPARRVRDNTEKHTLENCREVPEVVINVVSYEIVQQMSLSSSEYPKGVNEFEKGGFTMLKSDLVSPFRVAESPVQMECKVNEVVALGDEGGAGNLIICEVLRMHISEEVLSEDGNTIDQHKIDLVSRMGGNWYSRSNQGMFEVPKPLSIPGIGVDNIPSSIRYSKFLTGNELGMLGNISELPGKEVVAQFVEESIEVKGVLSSDDEGEIHGLASRYLKENRVEDAWKLLLARQSIKN